LIDILFLKPSERVLRTFSACASARIGGYGNLASVYGARSWRFASRFKIRCESATGENHGY
jgi:hypothetical protein